ncbi:MAG: CHRD domain-containing protein [Pseudohongiellaceae bacterium]
MKKTGFRSVALCVTTLTFLFCSQALLAQEVYRARLSPMPTTPQTVDEITGEGEVILTLNGNTLTVDGNFAGMSSAATAAHIHNGPPAQPGPVVHTLTVDQAPSGSISGTLELTDEQLTALASNALYVQVHSANNRPGELRGWIFLRSHFDN